jgi:hypothetical protein
MGAHNGAVDHRVFIVGVSRKMLENPSPDSVFRPAAEASMDNFPVAEAYRQVAPGPPVAVPVGRRLDKQTVVRRGHAAMTLLSGQQRPDTLPLVASKAEASSGRHEGQLQILLTPPESRFAIPWKPLNDDRL